VAAVFLAIALPWALPTLLAGHVPLVVTLELVGLYAIVRTIKFPIGAGSMVPSYLVLVPMLLLLPPQVVPLLTAFALVLGTGIRLLTREGRPEELLFSIPDAWHAIGPAAVLFVASDAHGIGGAGIYAAALAAGFVIDLVTSTLREALTQGVAPSLQGRVIVAVGLVDACIAPLGFVIALATRAHPAALLLVVPFAALLRIVDRDRSARIAEAQDRLQLVAHERTRLQTAVHRLGDALAAKLDMGELSDVLVRGCIDALDADAGCLLLDDPVNLQVLHGPGAAELARHLSAASGFVAADRSPHRGDLAGLSTLSLPLSFAVTGTGTMTVARRDRAFREDERALMAGLVERAQRAMTEILATDTLREQAITDPLTGLGNRRKLARDLAHVVVSSSDGPTLLMLFDLNGFKAYNDTFGHLAGDAMLARLGHKLAGAVADEGRAYRLGGDEFCVLLPATLDQLQDGVAAAADALEEHGERFTVTAACGTVLVPHEAQSADYALQLADQRMYANKQGRPSGAGDQAHDVLIRILRAKQPTLVDEPDGVAQLAVAVGRRMGVHGEQLDELARAAALHDIGKVGLPDAILTKPGPLDPEEWDFVHQHTLLGERILSAAPALRPVAAIVRATHERWDGSGYPDGLRGEQIPVAARIVAVCDAYMAMTSERSYRAQRPAELARRELSQQAGSQFDPSVVAALLAELDHPAGDRSNETAPLEDHATLAAKVASHVQELLLNQPR
jgi:diguanylate cyclase (GGDEF)-like protein